MLIWIWVGVLVRHPEFSFHLLYIYSVVICDFVKLKYVFHFLINFPTKFIIFTFGQCFRFIHFGLIFWMCKIIIGCISFLHLFRLWHGDCVDFLLDSIHSR